jgi:hypothetical protein
MPTDLETTTYRPIERRPTRLATETASTAESPGATLAASSWTSETGGAGIASSSSHRADRDAILRSLYDDRADLIDAEALGRLSEDDRARLSDIDREIERWEAVERQEHRAASDLWQRLEQIAHGSLDLQAQIEGLKGRSK